MQSLVVDKSCRGKGNRARAHVRGGGRAKARALTCVVLHTRIDREEARAFYARIGYTVAATSHLLRKALQP